VPSRSQLDITEHTENISFAQSRACKDSTVITEGGKKGTMNSCKRKFEHQEQHEDRKKEELETEDGNTGEAVGSEFIVADVHIREQSRYVDMLRRIGAQKVGSVEEIEMKNFGSQDDSITLPECQVTVGETEIEAEVVYAHSHATEDTDSTSTFKQVEILEDVNTDKTEMEPKKLPNDHKPEDNVNIVLERESTEQEPKSMGESAENEEEAQTFAKMCTKKGRPFLRSEAFEEIQTSTLHNSESEDIEYEITDQGLFAQESAVIIKNNVGVEHLS
jgi:hypothetical protein